MGYGVFQGRLLKVSSHHPFTPSAFQSQGNTHRPGRPDNAYGNGNGTG